VVGLLVSLSLLERAGSVLSHGGSTVSVEEPDACK
jgi:hypothetical protein